MIKVNNNNNKKNYKYHHHFHKLSLPPLWAKAHPRQRSRGTRGPTAVCELDCLAGPRWLCPTSCAQLPGQTYPCRPPVVDNMDYKGTRI